MIQILTRHFPFGTFKAMAVWPFILLKGAFTETDVRHEEIHGAQQKEMLSSTSKYPYSPSSLSKI